eukprot:4668874-Alexandrium_andersonii.AAC.1
MSEAACKDRHCCNAPATAGEPLASTHGPGFGPRRASRLATSTVFWPRYRSSRRTPGGGALHSCWW